MIETQLAVLSPAQRKLLEVASVSQTGVTLPILAKVLESRVDDAESVIETLTRPQQFLRAANPAELPGRMVTRHYAFIHELYRQVVYEGIAAERRVRLHQRIGATLEAAYAERVNEIAPTLAVHFERGDDPARAIRYLDARRRPRAPAIRQARSDCVPRVRARPRCAVAGRARAAPPRARNPPRARAAVARAVGFLGGDRGATVRALVAVAVTVAVAAVERAVVQAVGAVLVRRPAAEPHGVVVLAVGWGSGWTASRRCWESSSSEFVPGGRRVCSSRDWAPAGTPTRVTKQTAAATVTATLRRTCAVIAVPARSPSRGRPRRRRARSTSHTRSAHPG